MSTTVSYKGSTIATVENQTKILSTGGTWLEDDITLTDVSSSAPAHTATISGTTNSWVTYNNVNYSRGSEFEFYENDTASICVLGSMSCDLYIDGVKVASGLTPLQYDYTLPNCDIYIRFVSGKGYVTFNTISITSNGTYDVEDYIRAEVNVPQDTATLQTKTKSYTPTESQQTESVSADTGYDGLDTVNVTVGAISSTYVGTGIARKSSSDLTASGATVTAPAGYYESAATKMIASGTEGTPTATKETVSNHSMTVTPSVTNTAGYISGGTKTGTAVTVSASELVSGTKSITANETGIDVTNYASVDVNVPTGGSVLIVDTPDSHGGTIREITTNASTTALQGMKQVTLSASPTTVSPDTGYDGFESVVINSMDLAFTRSFPSGAVTLGILDAWNSCFRNRTGITSLSLPECTEYDTDAFNGLVNAEHIYLPKAVNRTYTQRHFKECTSLVGIALPKSTNTFWMEAFYGCSSLVYADLVTTGFMQTNIFNGCSSLTNLILRHTSVVTLANINHFGNTPFASGGTGGTIYIPKVLYDHLGDGTSSDYKAATNWATIDGYGTITWAKIEGSQYQNYYADGTPISTT